MAVRPRPLEVVVPPGMGGSGGGGRVGGGEADGYAFLVVVHDGPKGALLGKRVPIGDQTSVTSTVDGGLLFDEEVEESRRGTTVSFFSRARTVVARDDGGRWRARVGGGEMEETVVLRT